MNGDILTRVLLLFLILSQLRILNLYSEQILQLKHPKRLLDLPHEKLV